MSEESTNEINTTETDLNGQLPGCVNGMFIGYFKLSSTDSFTMSNLIDILRVMEIAADSETFDKLSADTRRQFRKNEDHVVFDPDEHIGMDEIKELFLMMNISISEEKYMELDDSTKKQFVRWDKGDELNFLADPTWECGYHLEPNDNCSVRDIAGVLECIDIRFGPAVFENIPEETKRQFVVFNRNMKSEAEAFRYGRIPRGW